MEPHDTLVSWWRVLEYLPKPNRWTGKWRANRGKRRSVRSGAYVHKSVFEQPPSYIAKLGLPDDHQREPE